MWKRYFLLSILLLFILSNSSYAQIHPGDKALLHYRFIGFSFPEVDRANKYQLEILDTASGIDQPAKPIILIKSEANKIIATVPAFGKKYWWRVKYLHNRKTISTSLLYSFTVSPYPFADTNKYRVHLLKPTAKYNDMLFFSDNTRTLYDMNGDPLWFLPDIKGTTDSAAGAIRDIKITKDGTITLLTTKNIYEIDYDAHILWTGPNDGRFSGDSVEHYHHQFTKLSNGHYMVEANKMVSLGKADTGKSIAKIACGCVVEFDKDKNVVWSWNSYNYLKLSDEETHFNSFFYDEKRNTVYTGYRNISTIVKVAYPSGQVLAQYGSATDTAVGVGRGQFYSQHNCSINSEGNLMMFNNNSNMKLPKAEFEKTIPTVLIFKEPQQPTDSLTKLWEFNTHFDSLVNPFSSAGGSVNELDNGDLLVCTGMPGRNLIVTRDKKILWDLTMETFDKDWKPFQIYKISPVRKAEISKLLFY